MIRPVMLHLSVLLTACLAASGCGQEEEAYRPLRPVQHETVRYSGGATTRTFSGTAETRSIVNLSFRSGGVITLFGMRVGQTVQRGELLARLDNVAARLSYEQAITAQNSAASQTNTAKLALDRVRALYEKGTASLSDYENARNSFRTAEASLESAERSVEIQRDQMSYGFIYAPESGTIAAVSAEVNENVNAGQTVAVLNAGHDMEIAVGLPESVINRISEGMEVSVEFSAVTASNFRGEITEIAPSVDPNTATYPVRVIVAEPNNQIRTGMAANVTFGFEDQDELGGLLTVPASAVAEDGDGRFVYVIESLAGDSASVRKQPVTIGRLTTEGFEIREGLVAGETIATAGLQTLLDGQLVRLR